MSWAYGTDGNGRPIGYGVPGLCDRLDCGARIDRGLAYRCGDLDCEDDDETPGCGDYFCETHLFYSHAYDGQLCETCADAAIEAAGLIPVGGQ